MQNLFCLLFPLLFYCIHSAPITGKNSILLDDESPMDISALRQSMHLRRLLDRIQITGLNHRGHVTSASEDPMKLLQRLRVQNKIGGNDGTELSVNRDIAHELFEGDILLSRPQAQQILREMENTKSLRRMFPRQLNPDPNTFWTDVTIPFTIVGGPNDVVAQSVFAAHRHISSLTCIRFAYYRDTTDLVGRRDFLEYSRLSGCWSMVGRQGGSQIVSIGFGCETLGIVVHETLHALGLWHEQSRTDQESYVVVNYGNILSGSESNFYKRSPDSSDNLGQPYDLGSVMHYSNKAFSRDFNQFSITSLDPSYQYTMGYRGGLSFKDTKMINTHYCSKICTFSLACTNGGYTDPNNCNRCACPSGYSGSLCDEIPDNSNPNCLSTGALMAGEFAGNISTVALTPKMNCYWKILPESANRRVMVTIKKLDFPCNRETCSSYVEVKAKQDKVATGARLCCAGVPSVIYAEIGAEVLIILSVVDEPTQQRYTGFDIEYKSISSTAQFEMPAQNFGNANNTIRGNVLPTSFNNNNTTIRWPNLPAYFGANKANRGPIVPNFLKPTNGPRGTFVPYSTNANNSLRGQFVPNFVSPNNNISRQPVMIAPAFANNLTRGQIQNITSTDNNLRGQILTNSNNFTQAPVLPTNNVREQNYIAPAIANNLTRGQIQNVTNTENNLRGQILSNLTNSNNFTREPAMSKNFVREQNLVAPTIASNLTQAVNASNAIQDKNSTRGQTQTSVNVNDSTREAILHNFVNANDTVREAIKFLYSIIQQTPTEQFKKH